MPHQGTASRLQFRGSPDFSARSLAALATATGLGATARAQAPAVVKVDTGESQGVVDDGVVHRGISFAAPPGGDLRWGRPSRRRGGQGGRKPRSTGRTACRGDSDPTAGAPAPPRAV